MMQSPLIMPMIYAALLLIVKGTVIGLCRFFFAGTGKMSYAQLTPGTPQGPKMYQSLNRAYINGIESFALFAPVALLISFGMQSPPEVVGTLGTAYILGRLLYTAIYLTMGYKVWVSFAWLVGFTATLVLYLVALMGA